MPNKIGTAWGDNVLNLECPISDEQFVSVLKMKN